MITNRHPQNLGLIIFIGLVFLAGCRSATTPVEFYTLAPLTSVSEADKIAGLGDNIAVGVGPLQIPKIIDRPQIVTRIGPNKINVDEFHRWAGSVYEDFLRAVTMNLAALLQSNLVVAFPWEEYVDPDYRVYLAVHQFDGRLGQYAQLDITWTITAREALEILFVRKSLIREPVQGDDYDAFIAAKSRILARLSRQIAQGIKAAHGGQ
ncbi:hypothetical protein D1BOALGB6SA_5794 [Olavius sp. associated proteobacterium Delta 1]|nr:hypothetical protein D1BOALGB6SA_5794 [Olavius sp. associated proteobacterium Delta 1]